MAGRELQLGNDTVFVRETKRERTARPIQDFAVIKAAAFSCALLVWWLALSERAVAVPPLVAGDVPTADKGRYELYVGFRYQKTGGIERQIPFAELVYGITDRQEVTFEIPYLSADGKHGFGDAALGTKYVFVRETERMPGIAGRFELKLDNGNETRGLGSGAMDYELRLNAQKTFGWFTGIANAGYIFVGEPTINGVRQARRDVVSLVFAQEYKVAARTKLLSEIYWKNSDERGRPNRMAGDIGFKHRFSPNLSVHAAIGKSLRNDDRGGPKLRVYAGIKLDF